MKALNINYKYEDSYHWVLTGMMHGANATVLISREIIKEMARKSNVCKVC